MFNRTMNALILGALLLWSLPSGRAAAEEVRGQFVVVAEVEIDPSQLESFKAAVKEDAVTAIRDEPGCLAFNAIFENDNPSHVRFFEIYADADAFKAHMESAHFKKYAATTKDMIKSRKRTESVPITLNVKGE
jgi:quinol monooxygenase YgiN